MRCENEYELRDVDDGVFCKWRKLKGEGEIERECKCHNLLTTNTTLFTTVPD